MTIVVVVLGLVLTGLVHMTDALRNQAKCEQARRLLTTLADAVEEYARVQSPSGTYPPGSFDASARQCLAALLALPQTREKLAGADWPWNQSLDEPAAWTDPWGRSLRYVTRLHDEQAVRMNGSRPFWVCAGPDGRFGDRDPSDRSDNISTDEPM